MWAVAIHGGAGPLRGPAPVTQEATLDMTLSWAEGELGRGAAALDVVEGAIRRLEDSARFIAGRGACPNSEGQWELDASICDGPSRRSGAVAALAGIYPPISIARAVMERTNHVLLAGEGARRFALESGFDPIADPSTFFAPSDPRAGDASHGTVGAVALDASGAIAAGTSTGGILNKRPGRVGDSPIVGAGTWADDLAGISCTGQGEYFIRAAAAHSVAMRVRSGQALDGALADVLADVTMLGGVGGMIAVTAQGVASYAFTAESMRVGLAASTGRREARVARR